MTSFNDMFDNNVLLQRRIEDICLSYNNTCFSDRQILCSVRGNLDITKDPFDITNVDHRRAESRGQSPMINFRSPSLLCNLESLEWKRWRGFDSQIRLLRLISFLAWCFGKYHDEKVTCETFTYYIDSLCGKTFSNLCRTGGQKYETILFLPPSRFTWSAVWAACVIK